MAGAAVAMVAFAANSLCCRLALRPAAIDPASFTVVRLASGAAVLVALVGFRARRRLGWWHPNAISALALFAYAAAFSLAYRELTAGTGALLLFGAVQTVMIAQGLSRGERPRASEWGGLVVALAGLGWLLAPGVAAPPLRGATLMISAGAAWAVYTLRGRTQGGDPLAATAANFIWAVPPALVFVGFDSNPLRWSGPGLGWALFSGVLASAGGYAVWYSVLPRLTAMRAATLQLSVPVLAALGGIAFLGEALSVRLVVASVLVLGGVALALIDRQRHAKP